MPSADPPLVVISERLGPLTAEELRLESAGAVVRSVPLWSTDQIHEQAADASFVILGAVEPFDAAALAGLPNLRGVVRRGVGGDNVDVDAATGLGIVVGYVPDASVEEVSDHALALLLTLERRVGRLDRAVHDGAWQKDARRIIAARQGMRRLSELTLGIVGFGRIGRALARKAGRIYREVLVADPIVTDDEAASGGGRLVHLDELWGAVDHISLHAPLLPSTRHVVNPATLDRIRPGAILVNTSRGGLVDETAAAAAVADGRLGGLALDRAPARRQPPARGRRGAPDGPLGCLERNRDR
jgi:D-3-phosphoglycerate dehydrogenase